MRAGRLIAVEQIADLLGKAKRRVRLELAEPAGLAELEALPGVSELKVEGRHASFLVGGDLDQAIKAIAGHHVTDVEDRPSDARGGLLSYYEEGGAG